MAIDPNIALGVRPIEQPNMMNQMAQMMQLRQAQQEYESQNALRDFYAKGGDMSNPEGLRQLRAINPKLAAELQYKDVQTRNLTSEISSRDLKAGADSLKLLKENVGVVNTPQDMATFLQNAAATPGGKLLFSVVPLDKALANIPSDPRAFQEYKRNFGLTSDKLFESADAQLKSKTDYGVAGMQINAQNYRHFNRPEDVKVIGDQPFGVSTVGGQAVVREMPAPGAVGTAGPVFTPTAAGGGGGAPRNALTPQGQQQAAPVNSLVNPPTPAAATEAKTPPVSEATQQAWKITEKPPLGYRRLPNGDLQAIPGGPADTTAKAPEGYRRKENGDLEYIPGGPKDPKVQGEQSEVKLSTKDLSNREAKYPQATLAVKTFESKTDELIKDIQELAKHPGLEGITGAVYGRTGSVSKESSRAQALYDKIVARGGFNELQAMRNASPTGGALGNVSNQEGQQLKSSFGALDRRQDTEDFKKVLEGLVTQLEGSKQRTKEAYDLTYEYRNAGKSGGGDKSSDKDDPLGLRK